MFEHAEEIWWKKFFIGFLRIIAVKIQHIKYEKTKKGRWKKWLKKNS